MGEIHYIFDGIKTVAPGDIVKFTVITMGEHNLEYWGVDAAGNEEIPHHIVPTFRIIPDPIKYIEITEPKPGFYLFGNKLIDIDIAFLIGAFTIEATPIYPECGFCKVSFYLNGELIAVSTEAPFVAYCAVKHRGLATIKVVAEDFSMNTDKDTLDVYYFKSL